MIGEQKSFGDSWQLCHPFSLVFAYETCPQLFNSAESLPFPLRTCFLHSCSSLVRGEPRTASTKSRVNSHGILIVTLATLGACSCWVLGVGAWCWYSLFNIQRDEKKTRKEGTVCLPSQRKVRYLTCMHMHQLVATNVEDVRGIFFNRVPSRTSNLTFAVTRDVPSQVLEVRPKYSFVVVQSYSIT